MTTTHVPPVVSETGFEGLPDRIVVSPGHGRLKIDAPKIFTAEGEFVRTGHVIACLHSDGRIVNVAAPCDAWIVDYLVRDGQRVEPGAQIVHLRAI
jgi:biotin carboxyl carrier protein